MLAARTRTWLFCCLGLVPMLAGNRGCEPEPPPDVCPEIWAPVCGIDQVTYSSHCHLDAAGVELAYEGECRSDGGLCLANDDCAMGQRCDHSECLSGCPDGAEACIAVCYGRCVDGGPLGCDDDADCARGEICVYDGGPEPMPFDDGTIYRPEHGVCVPVEPPPAGCFSDDECAPDEVCLIESEPEPCDPSEPGMGSEPGFPGSDPSTPPDHDHDGDGVPDELPPPDCVCTADYAPVCAADGVTYSNACNAACYGVPVVHVGECEDVPVAPPPAPGICVPREEPPMECGADGDCGPGFECRTECAPVWCEEGEDCDAHCHSYCAPIEPSCVCPEIWAPVCGASGSTWSNACEAECAGDMVVSDGECRGTEPVLCFADDDCGPGASCDHSECLSPCEGDEACIAVCYGQCVPSACGHVVCAIACEHGFELGPDGCEICACAPGPDGRM